MEVLKILALSMICGAGLLYGAYAAQATIWLFTKVVELIIARFLGRVK